MHTHSTLASATIYSAIGVSLILYSLVVADLCVEFSLELHSVSVEYIEVSENYVILEGLFENFFFLCIDAFPQILSLVSVSVSDYKNVI